MGLLDSVTEAIRKVPADDIMSGIIAEFFPGTLSGFLNEYLSGITAKDFYHEIEKVTGKGLLEYLDEGTRSRLMAIVPEDLSWFNLEWFVKQISEEHPDIVCLILSSEYVKKEVERQINIFKEACAR